MPNLSHVYSFSTILKIENIKNEIEVFIKGRTVKEIKLQNATWECSFNSLNDDYLSLSVSMFDQNLSLYKFTDNIIEHLHVRNGLQIVHEIIERRPNGIIYSIITKQLGLSTRFQDEYALTDLTEKRMVFSKETLSKLFDNIDFNNSKLTIYLLKFKSIAIDKKIDNLCNYCSTFETHMNYYINAKGGRKIRDNIYPTASYLNGEDVSSIFDVHDDKYKLYRVHDLYHGKINLRNEEDIYAIYLGLLDSKLFDFKTFKGITSIEEEIVGKSLLPYNDSYLKYLKEMFEKRFGLKGILDFSYDSILSILNCKKNNSTIRKRTQR